MFRVGMLVITAFVDSALVPLLINGMATGAPVTTRSSSSVDNPFMEVITDRDELDGTKFWWLDRWFGLATKPIVAGTKMRVERIITDFMTKDLPA
jgi:hypothetical protein